MCKFIYCLHGSNKKKLKQITTCILDLCYFSFPLTLNQDLSVNFLLPTVVRDHEVACQPIRPVKLKYACIKLQLKPRAESSASHE